MFLHRLTSCPRSHLCWIISSRPKCISPFQPARRHEARARIISPMAAASPQCTPATPGGPLPAGPGGPGRPGTGRREGAEQRLLEHVRATAPTGDAQAVLNAIDSYAWSGQEGFFMNVSGAKPYASIQSACARQCLHFWHLWHMIHWPILSQSV